MKIFALIVAGVLCSGVAAAEDFRHPSRVCVAVDAEGYQYLGYNNNAGDDALGKCIARSDSPTSCRVTNCMNDYGFLETFSAE